MNNVFNNNASSAENAPANNTEAQLISLENELGTMVQVEAMSSKQQMDEALRNHAMTLRAQLERLATLMNVATALQRETHRELEQTRRALTAFVNV